MLRRSIGRRDNTNLDVLRSFAVLIVLFVHILICGLHIDFLGPVDLRRFGRWGVLMFFVHTCLVLLYSLERNSGFWPFMARRVFRIYPLSVATVLFVVIFDIPAGFSGDHFFLASQSMRNVFLNLTLLQNVHNGESVLAPLWSLPYEMQMYVLLPGLFFLISLKIKHSEYALWLFGLFLAVNSWRSEIHGLPSLIFFPCFLSGVLAYKAVPGRLLPSWLWLPTIFSITSLFAFYPTTEVGWLCCFLLGLTIPRFAEITNATARRVAARIAKYSYGTYLLHFVFIWLIFDRLRFLPAWAQWALLFSALYACVFFVYHAIEAPMIRVGSRLAAIRIPKTGSPTPSLQRGQPVRPVAES